MSSNPFAHEPATRAPQVVARQPSYHVRRTGIIPLCIGASRIVNSSDGTKRQYEARELRVEAARAQRDGRTLNVSCLCFECRKVYATVEELGADHPSMKEMEENGESHTWAYWCDDKYDPKGHETAKDLGEELKALTAAHKACVQGIATLKDVESIMKERKRAEEIKFMADDVRNKKKIAEDAIIGLLSETPFTA